MNTFFNKPHFSKPLFQQTANGAEPRVNNYFGSKLLKKAIRHLKGNGYTQYCQKCKSKRYPV